MAMIVISGPSGVGKDAVVAGVIKAIPRLRLGASLTTRPARPHDEVSGKYIYVSREDFEARVAKGEVLEWATYNGNLYGTIKPRQANTMLLEIEVQGAAQVKQLFPDALLIFLVPPGKSLEDQMRVLAERLRSRSTDEPAIIAQRLAEAEHELTRGKTQSDVIIVNDELETAVRQTVDAIKNYLEKN